ncbi:MAG: hypothetical protein IJ688_04155 [Treponema sp.]|nr:hypothetical protein [Treponema sp.]
MKRAYFFILFCIFICILAGCASVPSDGVYNEKKQSEKKLRYDDWKYMGFGQQIPQWVEAAVEGKTPLVKKSFPEKEAAEFFVASAAGMNIDQAEESLAEIEVPEDFELLDTFWVRLAASNDGKPYIAVAVYSK